MQGSSLLLPTSPMKQFLGNMQNHGLCCRVKHNSVRFKFLLFQNMVTFVHSILSTNINFPRAGEEANQKDRKRVPCVPL